MMEREARLPIKLEDLLSGFTETNLPAILVSGICANSQHVKAGDLFFACRGVNVHGKVFIEKALENGAAVVVIESNDQADNRIIRFDGKQIPQIAVSDLSKKLGLIASRFYQSPSENMTVIGITGTNGKTSCSHMLAQCLDSAEHRCGVVGTLGAGMWGSLTDMKHTTPGPIELQKSLSNLLAESASFISMEVSSHGLEQGRVNGCQFDVAIFTNLSRDHLDYHGDMISYGDAKLLLFKQKELKHVVINLDDPFAEKIIANLAEHVEIVGVTLLEANQHQDFKTIHAKLTKCDRNGTVIKIDTPWGQGECHSSLIGEFNVTNILTVLATALVLGFSFDEMLNKVEQLSAPAGRLEKFGGSGNPLVVIDYAHTPDALQKVLTTLQKYTAGNLWVLFGCGGDRDRGKRAEMGRIAERTADKVWLTDDNPRTESSEVIINEILQGIQVPEKVMIVADRKQAIHRIVEAANEDDVVLIAGKGHEDYQIIGTTRYAFSDREIVSALVSEAA